VRAVSTWVAALGFAAPSGAQPPPVRVPDDGIAYRTTSWQAEQGLPQSSVTCVAETRDTFLWVGTFGGLARFDGAGFRNVRPSAMPATFACARFLSLHAHPHTGDLWLGTLGGGLVRRRGLEYVHFGRAHGLPGDSVADIATDGAGRLCVGTEAGAAWFDGERFVATGIAGADVHDLAARARGDLVAATDRGIYALTGDAAAQLAPFPAAAVAEDARERLWCSSRGRVLLLDGDAWRELRLRGPPGLQIGVLCPEPAGGMWLGTNCGAVRLAVPEAVDGDVDLRSLAPAPDPDATVKAICVDSGGAVWIGWSMFGVQRARQAQAGGIRIRGQPQLQDAFVVADDAAGGVWLGGRGLARLQDGELHGVPLPDGPPADVRALLPEATGCLWFSDGPTLCRLGDGRLERFGCEHGLPGTCARGLLRTRGGELWVATDRGLYAQRGEGFVSLLPDRLEGRQLLALVADQSRDDVWVGGVDVLVRLGADGCLRQDYGATLPSPPGEVRALLPLADAAWAVTYGTGLVRIKGDRTAFVDTSLGLMDDALCAAVIEAGSMYLSSNRGLFRCELRDLDAVADGDSTHVACERIVGPPGLAEEGAGGNQPSACRDRAGTLWFLTIDGVASVAAGALRPPPPRPRCGVRSVVAGGQRFEPDTSLELPAGVRSLSIGLGTSGFDPAVRPRFSWQLHPDEDWQEIYGEREVHLVGLRPGEHRFVARSANWSGEWSEPTRLLLIVPPLLTERAWFRVSAALLFAALCASLMLFGARRATRRSRRLSAEVDARTAQLSAEIAEHRATAAQLHAARDQLEARVRQRTDELVRTWQKQREDSAERERLEGRMQQLQRLESVRSLAGGIAHDFNNLLTIVLGSATLLRAECDLDAIARGLLDDLLAAGKRGSHLAQQLLMLASRQVVTKTVLDLDAVVERMLPTLQRLVGEGIEVAVQTAGEPARVLAAAVQIEQVLINLADNARLAMPGGGRLRIEVRTVRDQSGEGCARLRVEDDGVGMPPEVCARAFEPFFTTREDSDSSGLGLAAVAGIVRQLGGTTTIESEVGEGTVVEIVLPLTEAEVAVPRSPVPAGSVRGPILLVEDDPAVRRVVCRLLESLGYEVEGVGSGEQALALLRGAASEYALILSDLMLPGLHGVALANALRAAAPDASLVFMSGCWEILDSQQELLGPILAKPPSLEALAVAIGRSGSGRKSGA